MVNIDGEVVARPAPRPAPGWMQWVGPGLLLFEAFAGRPYGAWPDIERGCHPLAFPANDGSVFLF